MTFNEGDRVIHKTRDLRGTVLEVAGGMVYVETDNGVEMDFFIPDLMLETEYKSPEEERREKVSYADAVTVAVSELILAEVRNLLIGLAMMKAEKAAEAVVALGGTAVAWDNLNAFQKMNFISVSTNTQFIDWVDAYNENKMAKFQLTVIVALGQAVGIN